MSEAIRKILDAVTDRVFAYRPKDKGQQAKKIERRVKRERKKRAKSCRVGSPDYRAMSLSASRGISVKFLVMRHSLQPTDNQQPDPLNMRRRISQGLVGISPLRLYGRGERAGRMNRNEHLYGANGRFAVVGASDKGETGD